MPKVVGLRFRTSPKMYWFAPVGDDADYVKGAQVIVETQRGMEIATVVMPPYDIDESRIVSPLKSVLRMATEQDIDAAHADDERKQSILATAKQKVAERGLDMKIADCEFTVDHSKLVLYFTAEQRVDFRELVRDLASAFHMRIDLRQISARDECKLIGALGPCGMSCCCGRFESDSEHVSIKMAKNQGLALTPGKINGMCGRLLCCLGYENKTYDDILKRAPKHGAYVTAPDGRRGTVVNVTPLTETVRVRFGDDENFEFADYKMSDLVYERAAEQPQETGVDRDNGNQTRRNNKNNKNKKNNGGNNAAGESDGSSEVQDGRRDRDNNKNGKRKDRGKRRPDKPRGGKPEQDPSSQSGEPSSN